MESNYLEYYVSKGKDNNFNLLRFVAAFLVLYSHSYALSLGTGLAEPLRKYISMTPGTMAVDIFFITSGFLVTRSLFFRGSIVDFVAARILRIYPALIVAVMVTTVVVGLYFSASHFWMFMKDEQTIKYLVSNCLGATGRALYLPGAFLENPYKMAVNGSLWTLPVEIKMYGSLAALWVVALVVFKDFKNYFKWIVLLVPPVAAVLHIYFDGYGFKEGSGARLLYLFYAGCACYVLRNKIKMNMFVFFALCCVVIASLFAGKTVFFWVYMLAIPYVVMYVAYVPAGVVRVYNRCGDYSYGIYIYAFPVQQMVAATMSPLAPMEMFAYSATITFMLAYFSWNLIEKRALKLKATGFAALKVGVLSRG